MNHLIDLIQTVDFAVISWIYQAGGNSENIFIPLLDFIAVLFSYLGTLRIGAVIFGIYFWFKKETRPITIVLFAAILLSCSITWIIKEIVDRPRPYIMLGLSAADILIHTDPTVSFPSGHAASAFTTAAVVSYYFRKWLILVLTAACIAGLARIYLLVHYPSDVLAGAIIGIFCAFIIIKIKERK
ncbi:phosphatase PAP2 family protein [Methanimicrococcus sp. OttesenSCG-928-J09]|nr:phosphatase PAP2 family protein [Methanimicrococcus sp. OttesenSCG-928-J09]